MNDIGSVCWDNEELIASLNDFSELWRKRPIKDNLGGMQSVQMFYSWFITKKLQPKCIIESGVWKGLGTYFLSLACETAKFICIDVNFNNLLYINNKAVYLNKDITSVDLSVTNHICSPEDVLCFFDDHQSFVPRISVMQGRGYRHAIWEDNYPAGQGDCYTIKQSLESHDEMATTLFETLDVYYEMPPIYAADTNRWGVKWSTYSIKPPLLIDAADNTRACFYHDALDYTWLAYTRLRNETI